MITLNQVNTGLSIQYSCSVMSDSLRPHELQHARPPCPSPTPGVHSDSRPSSLWCHPAISSSVVPFSSFPQSLPASESFPMSQLFAWGGQSTGVSALASFLPKNMQDWSPLEWTGWISLKKIRDTKGTFHAKMGSIKVRNGMDLTEAEDIKRWQEYTEDLYQKNLHDPDNHDGVITHLEPDILEWNNRLVPNRKRSTSRLYIVSLFI